MNPPIVPRPVQITSTRTALPHGLTEVRVEMSSEDAARVRKAVKHLVEELSAVGLAHWDMEHVEAAEALVRTLENA